MLCKGRGAVKPVRLRVECDASINDRQRQIRAADSPAPHNSAADGFQRLRELRSSIRSSERAAKAKVICIYVVEPIVPAVGYTGLAEPMAIADISEQLEDSAERELPQVIKCEELHGLDIEEVIAHGDAAAEIV